MHILITGTGYVGLVTGACFAENGFEVTCLDINQEKITALQQGIIPIYEPGLEEIVKRNIAHNRLFFTTDYAASVAKADVIFLAVDTPVGKNGAADLTSLTKAITSIASHMTNYKVIVNKSTVPIGTGEYVRRTIEEKLQQRGLSIPFDIVSNPEFLKEGTAVSDFMRPDRVVIGTSSPKALAIMQSLYKPFMLSQERLIQTDIASAELIKYASNAMLATRISFMNMLSNLCEKTNANILEIRRGLGSDKRIGLPFLWAGCGFGGSCFPKDLKALQSTLKEYSIDSKLLDAVIEINDRQKELLFTKLNNYFLPFGGLEGRTIAILGLSFKPETDDIREAPAAVLIDSLLDAGCTVRLYDPIAMDNMKKRFPPNNNTLYLNNEYEAAQDADGIVLVTEWKQFRMLDFSKLKTLMRGNLFLDGRNQYDPAECAKAGFTTLSIGRNSCYANEEVLVHG